MQQGDQDSSWAIETTNLTYVFSGTSKIGLDDINLQIPWGSTNLIVGPNGAGKSTLLKIMAGKTLIPKKALRLGGFDPFEFSRDRNEHHNSDINNYMTYLGTEWAANSIIKRDIAVRLLILSVGGDIYQERRDRLIDILDIDPDWRMQKCSDGERRRVQIVMGLIKPWRLLLLDEVTIDLDVVVRLKLLAYLKEECEVRRCCVVYATHIFDGLGNAWCDRLIHLNAGRIVNNLVAEKDVEFSAELPSLTVSTEGGKYKVGLAQSLHPLALHWLHQDLEERGSREDEKVRATQRHNDWNNSRDGKYFDADESTVGAYFRLTRSLA